MLTLAVGPRWIQRGRGRPVASLPPRRLCDPCFTRDKLVASRGRKLNLVDVGIILFALALAAVGYQRGLLASALPLAGFVGGAALGARIGPALLDGGARSPEAPLVAVLTGVLARRPARGRARMASDGPCEGGLPAAGSGSLDGIGGALLLAVLALLIAWSIGAVVLHSDEAEARRLREAIQQSAILAALNEVLPPSGPLLRVLRRVDPRPVVSGPDADVEPPDRGDPRRRGGSQRRRGDGSGARHRLRARRRRLGLGRGSRARGHQRPCGRG